MDRVAFMAGKTGILSHLWPTARPRQGGPARRRKDFQPHCRPVRTQVRLERGRARRVPAENVAPQVPRCLRRARVALAVCSRRPAVRTRHWNPPGSLRRWMAAAGGCGPGRCLRFVPGRLRNRCGCGNGAWHCRAWRRRRRGRQSQDAWPAAGRPMRNRGNAAGGRRGRGGESAAQRRMTAHGPGCAMEGRRELAQAGRGSGATQDAEDARRSGESHRAGAARFRDGRQSARRAARACGASRQCDTAWRDSRPCRRRGSGGRPPGRREP